MKVWFLNTFYANANNARTLIVEIRERWDGQSKK